MFRTVPVLMFIVIIIGCSSASDQHRPGSTSTGDAKSRVNDIVSYDTQSNRTKIVPASYRKPKYGLDTVSIFDTAVNAGFGFKIAYNTIEYSDHQKDHNLLLITHNQNLIYCDSSQNEYELNDSLNPTIISSGRDTFELFLEVENSPNLNYLRMLKISSDKVFDSGKFPAFYAKLRHLSCDNQPAYIGFWDLDEGFGENSSPLVGYNPKLYYKVLRSGLVMDSIRTVSVNKEVYDKFYGFDMNDKISFSLIKVKKRFDKIDRRERGK